MMETVTKKLLAGMLMKYVNREIDLSQLVGWAEDMMQESDFEDSGFEVIRDILARLGLGDVHEFGLIWDDCYEFLQRLGYHVKVELAEA